TEEPLGLGRLHDPGFETLPPAGRQRGADLQLVELVCPVGRSRSASRSHHQPAVAAAGDCPQNPARRPDDAVGEQHAWRAASGAAGLSAHPPVLFPGARKSAAVGCSAALVSHPQRGAAKISARPATNPASTPAARLTPPAVVANWDANRRRAWRQLPDLGSMNLSDGLLSVHWLASFPILG